MHVKMQGETKCSCETKFTWTEYKIPLKENAAVESV